MVATGRRLNLQPGVLHAVAEPVREQGSREGFGAPVPGLPAVAMAPPLLPVVATNPIRRQMQ